MDYCMPRADNLPKFDFETRNIPSTTNPLGLKGAGEAGSIGSTPAVMNAVGDALWRAYRVEHIDMPATPFAIYRAISGRAQRPEGRKERKIRRKEIKGPAEGNQSPRGRKTEAGRKETKSAYP